MKVTYVLVNTEFNDEPGKLAAQACHACINLVSENQELFEGYSFNNPNSLIVLDGYNEESIHRFRDYLKENNYLYSIYRDESSGFRHTALAVGPFEKDDKDTEAIFKNFKLYKPINRYKQLCEKYDEEFNKVGIPSFPMAYFIRARSIAAKFRFEFWKIKTHE